MVGNECALQGISLGFYHVAAIVALQDKKRLLGVFSSLLDAQREHLRWLKSREDAGLSETVQITLPESPFQENSNWEIALRLAISCDRLFVARPGRFYTRETVLTKPEIDRKAIQLARESGNVEQGKDESHFSQELMAECLEVPEHLVRTLSTATQQSGPAAEMMVGSTDTGLRITDDGVSL